jgi:hypothetical protein
LQAKLAPVSTALPLSAYAGKFGDRTVTLKERSLIYSREGGPTTALVAIGPNLFAFEEDPQRRMEFKVSGESVTSLEIIRPDGSRVPAQRTP